MGKLGIYFKVFMFLSISMWGGILVAGSLKMRAREHYDVHKITRNSLSETYQGFSNTINIWYEKPFQYSFGLALGPLLGDAKAKSSALGELADKVKLINVGLEGKYFPLSSVSGFFSRFGAGWSQLRSDGWLSQSNGYHIYFGLGWEQKIGKLGLALELGHRRVELQYKLAISSWTPSIGLHFYEMF